MRVKCKFYPLGCALLIKGISYLGLYISKQPPTMFWNQLLLENKNIHCIRKRILKIYNITFHKSNLRRKKQPKRQYKMQKKKTWKIVGIERTNALAFIKTLMATEVGSSVVKMPLDGRAGWIERYQQSNN